VLPAGRVRKQSAFQLRATALRLAAIDQDPVPSSIRAVETTRARAVALLDPAAASRGFPDGANMDAFLVVETGRFVPDGVPVMRDSRISDYPAFAVVIDAGTGYTWDQAFLRRAPDLRHAVGIDGRPARILSLR
jgi:hypothetical protein